MSMGTIRKSGQSYEEMTSDLILEIADKEGKKPEDLPSLSEFIDRDALENLIASNEDITLSFVYMGYRIVWDRNMYIY